MELIRWIVDEYVDGVLTDSNVFTTKRQAINYVSGEYTYYSKKYVETERFNVATTLTKPINEIDFEKNEDETCYCEPFDDNLRCAYIDEWDNLLEWIIKEQGEQ